MSELKPCPFCGKEMTSAPTFGDTLYKINTHEEPGVYCPNCGAIGPNDVSYERADEMWNLRRLQDSQVGAAALACARLVASVAALELELKRERELSTKLYLLLVDNPNTKLLADQILIDHDKTEVRK